MTKYFAEISITNTVLTIVVADDIETETSIKKLLGSKNFYKETLKSGHGLRANAASVGGTYDNINDVFIPPQPYPSWTLNSSTYIWEPPVAKPTSPEGAIWEWDETTLQWIDNAPTTI